MVWCGLIEYVTLEISPFVFYVSGRILEIRVGRRTAATVGLVFIGSKFLGKGFLFLFQRFHLFLEFF